MSKGAYIGIDNKARKINGCFIGVDNVARKVKKIYVGVDGVARLVWDFNDVEFDLDLPPIEEVEPDEMP